MLSSAIIPVYNQTPAYLRAAILSVREQTVPCEIIVVDDGSNPPCHTIVCDIPTDKDHPIIYVQQENGGVSSAMNKGLEYANGEYIQWLSSDDLYRAEKTEIQTKALQDSGEMICYCTYEEGIPTIQNVWPAAQYPNSKSLFDGLRQHSFINACTVMWHRDVFDEVGEFDINMRHMNDTEMILRCAERYNFVAVDAPLVRRRIHPGQMINTLRQEDEAKSKQADLDYVNKRYGATLKLWVPNAN
jgi:glycosyltransferase involved in cell wall biosynthesis